MTPAEANAAEIRVAEIVGTLPQTSFLRNYVHYAAALTDANAMYHLGVGLAVLSQAVPRDLSVRHGNRLYSNLYVLVVGDSTGSRKSTSVELGREVLNEAMPERDGGHPGSWEGLADSLTSKPHQLLSYGEFGQFLAQAKEGYFAAIKQSLTAVYDGEKMERTLAVKRTYGTNGQQQPRVPSAPAPSPRLSLIGAVTPGFLSELSTPSDWEDGFFGRFLTFYATRARTYITTPSDLRPERAWLAHRLRAIGQFLPAAPPTCGGINPEVHQAWADWQAGHAQLIRMNPWGAAAIGRAQGHALKIAMMLAWDSFEGVVPPDGWTIRACHLLPAMAIVQLHINSVLEVVAHVGGTRDMNDRCRVLGVLTASPDDRLSLGVISNRARLLTKRTSEILDTLKQQGVIRYEPDNGQGSRLDMWQLVPPTPWQS